MFKTNDLFVEIEKENENDKRDYINGSQNLDLEKGWNWSLLQLVISLLLPNRCVQDYGNKILGIKILKFVVCDVWSVILQVLCNNCGLHYIPVSSSQTLDLGNG